MAVGPELLEKLLARIGVGLISTDAQGLVEHLSPLAETLTGWSRAEATGQQVDRVFHIERDADLLGSAARVAPEQVTGPVDQAVLVSRTGQRFTIEHTLAPRRGPGGRIEGIEIAFHDTSERSLAELQLARQAWHDPLTGLLNAPAFLKRLEQTVAGSSFPFAVCQLDLDQFNLVNSTCGHGAGDRLLHWVAALLREEVRPHDVLAHLTGDVFSILLLETDIGEARRVVEQVLGRLRDFQFSWDDKSFSVRASIGLVVVRKGPTTAREVATAVDHACAIAKQRGRDQIWICHLEDEELARRSREAEWVARIRKHLHDGDVTLFGQRLRPVRGDDGGLRFEVLLRANDEHGQPCSVPRLIEAAERYGLMPTIDRWVVRNALQALARADRAALNELRLCSINLSGVSLRDTSFLEFIHQQIARSGVPPSKLCFELTETAVVSDLPRARWLIEELLAIGCRFALDDFGSGLASYAHLRDLPVNFLKISGEFIENMATNELDRAMVASIVQIARVLEIPTVAEAVSSNAAYQAIAQAGVDMAQGNWVAPPEPLSRLLRR